MDGSTIGEWSDQEFNVFDGDALVGRILRSQVASSDSPWLWTIVGSPSDNACNRGYSKNLETALSEMTSQWETGSPAAA